MFCEIKQASEAGLSGYGAVFGNKDRSGEIIDPFAVTNLDEFVKSGAILVGHNWGDPGVATISSARQDDYGVWIEAMWLDTPSAAACRDIVRQRLQRGKSVGLSIGYRVIKDEYVEGVRHLKEIEIYEVSIVPIPSNPLATVTSAKSAKYPVADVTFNAEEANIRWKEATGSKEHPSKQYKDGFFIVDGDPNDFSSYKLQYVDVLDGRPCAIASAILSAVGTAIVGYTEDFTEVGNEAKAEIYAYYTELEKVLSRENEEHKSGFMSTSTLCDHIISAYTPLSTLTERVKSLVNLRHSSGKTISPSTASKLRDLVSLAEEIKECLKKDDNINRTRGALKSLRNKYGGNKS